MQGSLDPLLTLSRLLNYTKVPDNTQFILLSGFNFGKTARDFVLHSKNWSIKLAGTIQIWNVFPPLGP